MHAAELKSRRSITQPRQYDAPRLTDYYVGPRILLAFAAVRPFGIRAGVCVNDCVMHYFGSRSPTCPGWKPRHTTACMVAWDWRQERGPGTRLYSLSNAAAIETSVPIITWQNSILINTWGAFSSPYVWDLGGIGRQQDERVSHTFNWEPK
jgi:hypothetical protein